jgi:hypothetical protein
VHFGAFYDPITTMDMRKLWRADGKLPPDAWKVARTEAQEEAKRLLRLQVKDFIDWLKGQGVI